LFCRDAINRVSTKQPDVIATPPNDPTPPPNEPTTKQNAPTTLQNALCPYPQRPLHKGPAHRIGILVYLKISFAPSFLGYIVKVNTIVIIFQI